MPANIGTGRATIGRAIGPCVRSRILVYVAYGLRRLGSWSYGLACRQLRGLARTTAWSCGCRSAACARMILARIWLASIRHEGILMKTAVVTGAAQGVGLVTAAHLARLGYRVLLTDIQALDSQLSQLKASGFSVEGAVGD